MTAGISHYLKIKYKKLFNVSAVDINLIFFKAQIKKFEQSAYEVVTTHMQDEKNLFGKYHEQLTPFQRHTLPDNQNGLIGSYVPSLH